MTYTREGCKALDQQDELRSLRDHFDLPEGETYLDGNSLGPMPRGIPARLEQALKQEWAQGLIRSWNDADWYPAPLRTGGKIARLIGAQEHEVVVADSTSINLFKVLVAALRMQPGRKVILAEKGNFPTDVYIASGVAELLGCELRCAEPEEVMEALDEDVAILSLTHVNYKSGRRYDMQGLTRRAHDLGALVVWDLCHSAGAMPIHLNAVDADFAVGCGYKYLNGGPGAPAFVYVAERHLPEVRHPLTGWHGHARPFEFIHDYEPHAGIDRMLVGTASQLGLIALEEALGVFQGVSLEALRTKSERLTDLFIALYDQELGGYGFELASPRDAEVRGSQVSLTHPEGYAIMQTLIERGVIGDFRAPDILRFGFAPLYIGYVDVWNAVATLKDVMDDESWKAPRHQQRKAVT